MDAQLENILRSAGKLPPGTRILSVTPETLEGSGLVGKVQCLQLTYDHTPGPASLILKLPAEQLAEGAAFSQTEVCFYQQAKRWFPGIPVPEFYGSEKNHLLLEELHHGCFVKQLTGCSAVQAQLAIRQIAQLHAQWWDRELPADLDWVQPLTHSPAGNFCTQRLQLYHGEWPALLQPWLPNITNQLSALQSLLLAAPRTIVHGDYHSQNIFFREDNVTLIDFQFMQQASGMLDVARFIATSLTTELRRAIESDLLESYRACLHAQGIHYPAHQCLQDYKAALLWNLLPPVALHLVNVTELGKPWPTQFPILQKCITAIEDWEAMQVL
jgi:hypothetical protein